MTANPLRLLAGALLTFVAERGSTTKLCADEIVEVRSKEEILRTLTRDGRLDGLPFMPQMFQYCGTKFRVLRRAHKTCDTIHNTGGRRMQDAVHLVDIRCDGEAYAKCGAGCLIFWKEAWLKRVSHAQPTQAAAAIPVCTQEDLTRATIAVDSTEADPRYSCQATELLRATERLPWWDLRQYLEDYAAGNVGLFDLVGGAGFVVSRAVINKLGRVTDRRSALLRLYDTVQRLRGGVPFPRRTGLVLAGERTPLVRLGLQPGEFARLKPYPEILKTLDDNNKNRGLFFDAEEVPYCGGTYRVRSRVTQIIDERSGRSIPIGGGGAVILEGVSCQGHYSKHRMFCPRGILPFFREAWVDRVVDSGHRASTASFEPMTQNDGSTPS
jgi:hypothetical protein